MILRGATRSVVGGLAFTLLSVASLSGLAHSAPPVDWRPFQADTPGPPTVTVTATLPSATVTPTLTLTPTPEPTEPPAAPCRLEGGALVPDAVDGNLFLTTLHNAGATTATLSALQLGWDGRVLLSSVAARTGAADIVLFQGFSTSPALITLADAAGAGFALGPDQSVTLAVRFSPKPGVPAEPAIPGPGVLFTREGCVVALAAPPTAAGCGLTAALTRPADDHTLAVALSNSGTDGLDVATVEVNWPATQAGALTGIGVDGGSVVTLASALGAAPAVLDLARLLGAAPHLAPGGKLALSLVFERSAQSPPASYSVVVATRQGCLAAATLGRAAVDSGVTAQGFDTRGDTALLRLSNRRGVTRTLSALSLFWPTTANGPLIEVAVGGKTVWTGALNQAPATLMLQQPIAIGPEATVQLQLTFQPPAGNDPASRSIASGDYTILAWLLGGRAVTFSTATGQALRCSIATGEWTANDKKQAMVTLTNAGAEATLRQLVLSWPARNGALVGVWLGNTQLFNRVALPGSMPFVLTFLPGSGVVLPRNDARLLLLSFSDRAVRSGYSASLQFDDPAGASCADVMVTSRPVTPECQLTLPSLAVTNQRDVEVAVDSKGADELEIGSVTVEWQNPLHLVNVVQAALVDAADHENVFWTGEQLLSPATIRPTGPVVPIVPPQATSKLRLRFSQLLNIADPGQAFKVTLATVEGCRATFAPSGDAPPPVETWLGGVIRELPRQSGLFGTWRVDVINQGTKQIEVNKNTRFNDASVSPAPGDSVRVLALVSDDGQVFTAEEIQFPDFETAQTLEGSVDALGPGTPPAWLSVAGQKVSITAATLIDNGKGSLQVGADVTVKGRRQADGQIVADSITVRSQTQGEAITFIGVLQDVRADGGSQLWEVDRYVVRVASDTKIINPPKPVGSPPPLGKRVEVHGHLNGSEVIPDYVNLLNDPVVVNRAGTITSMPATGLLGEWEVLDLATGKALRFTVASPSVVDTSAGPAVPGMVARVRLQDQGGGTFVALRVRIDWPD